MRHRVSLGWIALTCMWACQNVQDAHGPVKPSPQSTAPPSEAAPTVPAVTSPTPVITHPQSFDFSGIDPLVVAAIAKQQLPGCVVTIGSRDGVLLQRAYGKRAVLPTPEPMTLDTRFDLASLSKSVVTAVAIMQLVEAGKVTLDTRAIEWLPELGAGPDSFHKRAITLRHLLLHTSGLPAVTPLSDYERPREQAIATMLKVALIDKPGARFVYSDVGFIALGEIIQRASGQPLDTYANEHIFAPLSMTRSSYALASELRAQAAPTELGTERDGQWIRGVVHDPRAYRLQGVAGNAGVFSTADDLARLARALLNNGQLDGQRALTPRAIRAMTEPHFIGTDVRALGWDMDSRYSNNGGDLLSPSAYGHGGYTGTSLWIDPQHDLFVLFLSNRVHPNGNGNVIQLAGAIANHAVSVITRATSARDNSGTHTTRNTRTQTGIDVLRANHFDWLRDKRIGLITNASARANDGVPTLDHFKRAKHVVLKAVFTPEHGINADHEGNVAHTTVDTSVPVFSLFGATRKPTARMLEGIDTLVFDLQDVGVRFYTYASTLVQVLEAAHEHNIDVLVLDRPNPLGGVVVEGPLQDEGVKTFVNYHRLPVRHGMTIGELARLLNTERNIHASLEVIAMTGWQRSDTFEDTGLTWTAPSPNLRTTTQAWLYPALGLLESTNVTVGRGTELPFEIIGAPWLDAHKLADRLRAQFPDMRFVPMQVTPTAGPHRGQQCHVVHVGLADRHRFQPILLALAIAQHLALTHPEWNVQDLYKLLASRAIMSALRASNDVAKLSDLWTRELAEFKRRRSRVLLYPD